eukprot:2246900-Karenia_brevis.AAC.1
MIKTKKTKDTLYPAAPVDAQTQFPERLHRGPLHEFMHGHATRKHNMEMREKMYTDIAAQYEAAGAGR